MNHSGVEPWSVYFILRGLRSCLAVLTVALGTCGCVVSGYEHDISRVEEISPEEVFIQRRDEASSSSIEQVQGSQNLERKALVIGNANYEVARLRNPANDAIDVARTLEELGFDVSLHVNVGREEMGKEIARFGKSLSEGGIGLFYFAGHGIQVEGKNFLIPVDSSPEDELDVEYEAIDVNRVLGRMESARNDLNIVILDSCRNNPFRSRFRSSSRGLARVDAPVGSVVVYATAPGKVAADGDGRNGVFTKHLLPAIREPGVPLLSAIRRTRINVMKETNSTQVPWVSESTTRDFYFAGQESAGLDPS